MIVDDSAVVRAVLRRIIESEPKLSFVAAATNGAQAVELLKQHAPVDVILLDIDMPVIDGLTALPLLKNEQRDAHILMASTLTTRNAGVTLQAMQKGASDYIAKPDTQQMREGPASFKAGVLQKVIALCEARQSRSVSRGGNAPATSHGRIPGALPAPRVGVSALPAATKAVITAPAAIALGASTGGPQVLTQLLQDVGTLDVPVFVTQHMPATFTPVFAAQLDRTCAMTCAEAADGQLAKPGHVYIAPGGQHLTVRRSGGQVLIALNDGPEEHFCRPAVDPMFRSLVQVYGASLLAAVLTGMGADGAAGAVQIKNAGGTVLVQDEHSSVVWGMPGATLKAGGASDVLTVDLIAASLRRTAGKGV